VCSFLRVIRSSGPHCSTPDTALNNRCSGSRVFTSVAYHAEWDWPFSGHAANARQQLCLTQRKGDRRAWRKSLPLDRGQNCQISITVLCSSTWVKPEAAVQFKTSSCWLLVPANFWSTTSTSGTKISTPVNCSSFPQASSLHPLLV